MTKYIFVTGGVLSSLGKGVTAASIGALLKHSGKKVGMLKIDPYINVDPGTMSPLEHGEVFVTRDGAETDLDIGNYERFLDTAFLKTSNFTTGQVYSSVIERERSGGYLGQTIQVIPHIVGEIVDRIKKAGEGHDILVVELGGTVGDIEGQPFLEAVRQMKHDDEVAGTFFVHVTLIPYIKAAGEHKSKPTQHSVQELRRIGITPQMIIARSEMPLPKTFKKKLAFSCDVSQDSVIEALDAARREWTGPGDEVRLKRLRGFHDRLPEWLRVARDRAEDLRPQIAPIPEGIPIQTPNQPFRRLTKVLEKRVVEKPAAVPVPTTKAFVFPLQK